MDGDLAGLAWREGVHGGVQHHFLERHMHAGECRLRQMPGVGLRVEPGIETGEIGGGSADAQCGPLVARFGQAGFGHVGIRHAGIRHVAIRRAWG